MVQSMVQPAFSFRNNVVSSSLEEGSKLCIELGQFHVGITISNPAGSEISSFDLFSAKQKITPSFLQSVLSSEMLSGVHFSDVVMIHNQKEMTLVPSALYSQYLDTVLIETIHGDQFDLSVSSDDVHQWELHNVYGTDKSMFSMIVDTYPQARQVQYMSVCLRSIFRTLREDASQWLKLYILPSCINLVVLKGEQLQIAQSFYYETPEDIIYNVLNVVDKYRLDVAEAIVEVSGLIDSESAIWKELKKYFLNIELEPCSSVSAESQGSAIPSHYFTPFFLVPKCV